MGITGGIASPVAASTNLPTSSPNKHYLDPNEIPLSYTTSTNQNPSSDNSGILHSSSNSYPHFTAAFSRTSNLLKNALFEHRQATTLGHSQLREEYEPSLDDCISITFSRQFSPQCHQHIDEKRARNSSSSNNTLHHSRQAQAQAPSALYLQEERGPLDNFTKDNLTPLQAPGTTRDQAPDKMAGTLEPRAGVTLPTHKVRAPGASPTTKELEVLISIAVYSSTSAKGIRNLSDNSRSSVARNPCPTLQNLQLRHQSRPPSHSPHLIEPPPSNTQWVPWLTSPLSTQSPPHTTPDPSHREPLPSSQSHIEAFGFILQRTGIPKARVFTLNTFSEDQRDDPFTCSAQFPPRCRVGVGRVADDVERMRRFRVRFPRGRAVEGDGVGDEMVVVRCEGSGFVGEGAAVEAAAGSEGEVQEEEKGVVESEDGGERVKGNLGVLEPVR